MRVEGSWFRGCVWKHRAVEQSGTLHTPPPPPPLGQALIHGLGFMVCGEGRGNCGDPPQFIEGFPPLVCGVGGAVGERTTLRESNKRKRTGGRPAWVRRIQPTLIDQHGFGESDSLGITDHTQLKCCQLWGGRGPTWREDALFWDRPRVEYHRVY